MHDCALNTSALTGICATAEVNNPGCEPDQRDEIVLWSYIYAAHSSNHELHRDMPMTVSDRGVVW